MKLTFEMNQVRYRDGLNRFVFQMGADADKLLREEMRLFLRDIIRLTPPTKSPRTDEVKYSARQRGNSAIESDLQRLATPLDWKETKNPKLAEAIYRRDLNTMQAIMRNIPSMRTKTILSSEDAIRQSHLKYRNRYGRILKKNLNQVAFLNDWRRYVGSLKKRVGYAQAGWLKAAEQVGLPLPSWVRRHAGYARGGFEAPTPQKAIIVARNGSVKVPNYQQRHVNYALAQRVRSIEREAQRLLRGGKTTRASFGATVYGQPRQ